MQEALATGIPVISSDTGFNGYEFKADYTYKPDDLQSLCKILDEIQQPRLARRKQVEGLSWSNYCEQLIKFIEQLKEQKYGKT